MQTELRGWTVKDSVELYNVNGWGRDFFTINEAGNVEVTPAGPGSLRIDLKALVDDLLGDVEVIVGARIEAEDLIRGSVLRRQQEDGEGAIGSAEAATHLQAIHPRHHNIQNHERRRPFSSHS